MRPDEQEAARAYAARAGLPGTPVSMRMPGEEPGAGSGTGHWQRRVGDLAAAVERARTAVAAVPPGPLRDALTAVVEVLDRRQARYAAVAVVGQALAPDDDTTDDDGTRPGALPELRGAADEIDDVLVQAADQLTDLAGAIGALVEVATGIGGLDADLDAQLETGLARIRARIAGLRADLEPP